MTVLFVQWYTGAMLLIDFCALGNLWGPALADGTVGLVGSSAPRLSQRSMWFDKHADSPVSAAVFTFVVLFLMLPRIFVVAQPVNRWILLNAALMEVARLVLFSLLFSVNGDATPANTLALTFMGWNVFYYARTWYSTMCMLLAAMKN